MQPCSNTSPYNVSVLWLWYNISNLLVQSSWNVVVEISIFILPVRRRRRRCRRRNVATAVARNRRVRRKVVDVRNDALRRRFLRRSTLRFRRQRRRRARLRRSEKGDKHPLVSADHFVTSTIFGFF